MKNVKKKSRSLIYRKKVVLSSIFLLILIIGSYFIIQSLGENFLVKTLESNQSLELNILSAVIKIENNQSLEVLFNYSGKAELKDFKIELMGEDQNYSSEINLSQCNFNNSLWSCVFEPSMFNELNNFTSIESLQLAYGSKKTVNKNLDFKWPIEGNRTAPANPSANNNKHNSSKSGGGGGGGGSGNSCVPTITCSNYLGQCSASMSNGCTNTLDCSNNCLINESCVLGVCQPLSPSCINDEGCTGAGGFCDNNTPYNCSIGEDGCFDRLNLEECGSLICSTGECHSGTLVSSCTNIVQSGTYIIDSSLVNDSLEGPCINVYSADVVIDCNRYNITSSESVSGIYSNNSGTTIRNCQIAMGSNSGGFGIEIENASNALVEDNIINSQYTGIYFHNNVTNSVIRDNVINNNTNKGIHLSTSSKNNVSNNLLNNGSFYGIILTMSSENNISYNNLSSNVWYGILIESSLGADPDGNNTLYDNIVKDSRTGIYIKTSDNVIENNFVNSSTLYHGLYLYSGNNNSVVNNTLNYNAQYGLRVRNSDNNTIVNNTAIFNNQQALEVSGTSSNNDFEGNIFCFSISQDVSCEIDQIFGNNYGDSGAGCGGIWTGC